MNDPSMTDDARDYLIRRFETAWKRTSFRPLDGRHTVTRFARFVGVARG